MENKGCLRAAFVVVDRRCKNQFGPGLSPMLSVHLRGLSGDRFSRGIGEPFYAVGERNTKPISATISQCALSNSLSLIIHLRAHSAKTTSSTCQCRT